MASSTPESSESPDLEPSLVALDSVAAQRDALDLLVRIATRSILVFDVDLSQMGWNTAVRTEALASFVRRSPDVRANLIVHDTRYVEGACPRLALLMRSASAVMTIYRTGASARNAQDPLAIVDGRHFLHRFHIDQPRASFGLEQPALARPLVRRFEEIWATGEPGLGATVLGL